MIRRGTGAVIAVIAASVVLAVAASSGSASPKVRVAADVETLVAYLPAGKIKVAKNISYRFQCLTACQITASSTLVLKGPNLGPAVDTGMFTPGDVGAQFLTLNKGARLAIKSHLGASKLRTSITAVDASGATDTDTRVFKFKR